ncbi:hypothetical protein K505DRAFT_338987 [Melanomma pulvis-pyrius CBS 109.77]|uniref:Uncharacterized protein n=1 Tax=Melanomma pulvis-pyrius CBS 109.77 TaxID=1314802 RepID=A0A6A6X7U7_9PLEO|nr:hypothetical protein K505DRAFT_338987 [Melanomma pulvis-pyrius CBS 109.77]
MSVSLALPSSHPSSLLPSSLLVEFCSSETTWRRGDINPKLHEIMLSLSFRTTRRVYALLSRILLPTAIAPKWTQRLGPTALWTLNPTFIIWRRRKETHSTVQVQESPVQGTPERRRRRASSVHVVQTVVVVLVVLVVSAGVWVWHYRTAERQKKRQRRLGDALEGEGAGEGVVEGGRLGS